MRAIVRTTWAGSRPMAVSPDSISASVPSNTALATSLTSARVGAGAVIIDSSIWVAVITGTPAATRPADDRLLRQGHRFEGHLDAEITAGHHHGVGHLEDLGEMVHGRNRLDLGHDLRAVSADDVAHGVHIGAGAHERHGD